MRHQADLLGLLHKCTLEDMLVPRKMVGQGRSPRHGPMTDQMILDGTILQSRQVVKCDGKVLSA